MSPDIVLPKSCKIISRQICGLKLTMNCAYFARMICVIFAMSASSYKSSAQESNEWIIKVEHFKCLKKHIDTYIAIPKDKIVIFLNDCPETDIAKIIARNTRNSSLPTVKKKKQGVNSPAEVIAIEKDFLPCLAKIEIPTIGKTLRVSKKPCG